MGRFGSIKSISQSVYLRLITTGIPSKMTQASVQRATMARAEQWFRSLFPVMLWIRRYNVQWLAGDLVAGMLPHIYFKCITHYVKVSL